MTPFDYAVLAIAAASLVLGLLRGVVSEVLALAAWIVAFLAAREAAPAVGSLYADVLREPALQYLAGFVSVVVLVLIAFAVLRLALRGLLRAAGLGATDRVLGALFGLARAGVIVLALVLVGGMTSAPRQAWWREAYFAPPLETAAIAVRGWLPESVARRIRYR